MTDKQTPELNRLPPSPRARPTIGFFVEVTDEYHCLIWSGVQEVSRQQDVNLITFIGGSPGNISGFWSQSTIIYNLAHAGNLDGLIMVSGNLNKYISPEEFTIFYQRYTAMPMVSLVDILPNIPSIMVDNQAGLRNLITHLIVDHGYRRIACITGPAYNVEAQQRYQVYTEVLAQHGLPLNPDLVVVSDYYVKAGMAAMNDLLDRQTDIEAVIAPNDPAASGVMQALQQRGLRVPEDVAVIGFDDRRWSKYTIPPLSTVRQPIADLGRRAVELLLAQLRGEAAPELTLLPTEMVTRRSCGCPLPILVQTAAGPVTLVDEPLAAALARRRLEIMAEMAQTMGESQHEFALQVAGKLLDAFKTELTDQAHTPGAFLAALEQSLHQAAPVGGELTGWHGVISTLRRRVLPYLGDNRLLVQAEDLWQQARVMIGEIERGVQVNAGFRAEEQSQTLREIEATLITTFDLAELTNVLVKGLPRLGIESCYLVLYENPPPYQYPQPAPEWSRLILAYAAGQRLDLEAGGRRFPSRQLLPEGVWPEDRQLDLLVEPLFFREQQIGFILFDAQREERLVYEVLRGQISSALKGSLLVQQEEKRAHQLQTVAEVGAIVSTILDTQKLLQTVVDLTKDRFNLYHAHIYLFDEIGDTLVLTAGAGEVGRLMVADKWSIPRGREQSLVAKAFRTQQGIIVNDVRVNPDWLPNPLLPDTCAELAVPLLIGERALGVLDVQSDRVGHFTEDDVRVQTTLAAQIAVALENARLFEQSQKSDMLLRERVKELDCLNDIGREMEENPPPLPELLQWITERIPAAMNYPHLSVAAIEFDGQVYGRPEAIPLPNQITHGLYIGGQIMGRIYIAHTEKHDFIDEESALLGGIATRVSGFIENQRLFEQTRQRAIALEEATNFLDSIIENIPTMLFVKEAAELRFVRWNKAGEELNGRLRAEMLGKNDYDFFPKAEADFFVAKDREILNSGKQVDILEEPIHTPHRGLRFLDTRKIPILGPDGKPKYLLGLSEDITERKQTEEERGRLLAEVRRLAAIVENHPDFIGVGTMSGQVLYVNPAGLKMMGLPPDYKVSALQINDFYPPEDANRLLQEGVPQALAKGYWSTEANLRQADGVIVPVEETVSIILDTEGQPSAFSVTMHDITNRKVAATEQARLLTEVEAAYRQFVRREWEKYLTEQHQGQWHIEHQQTGLSVVPEAEAWLAQTQAQVLQEGKTKIAGGVAASDEAQTQAKVAALVAPIVLRGQVIGTLNLQDASNNRAWTAEEIALVEAVSEQLALTVENLRLFDDTQRRATREQLTRQITDKLHTAPDVDSIIQTGLTELAKSLGVSRTYVKLSSPAKQK